MSRWVLLVWVAHAKGTGLLRTSAMFHFPLVQPSPLGGAEMADEREQIEPTPRERDLLPLLVQGLTNAEIAAALSLTTGTVANYVERLLHKLGFSNRTQLAVWARCGGSVTTSVPPCRCWTACEHCGAAC